MRRNRLEIAYRVALKILKFHTICRYIVRNKISFWSTSYSAYVVYTKTLFHLSVGKYPSLFTSTSTSVDNCELFMLKVNLGEFFFITHMRYCVSKSFICLQESETEPFRNCLPRGARNFKISYHLSLYCKK